MTRQHGLVQVVNMNIVGIAQQIHIEFVFESGEQLQFLSGDAPQHGIPAGINIR